MKTQLVLTILCTLVIAVSNAKTRRTNGVKFINHDSPRFIKMQLYKDDRTKDETIIFLKNKASTAFDGVNDGVYMQGLGQVRLFSYSSDRVPLVFNTQPLPVNSTAINLNVFAKTDGRYQLKVKEINNLPPLFDIWLIDNYLKDSLDIRNNPEYAFNVSKADTNTFGGRRFTVVVRQSPARACHLLNFAALKLADINQVKTHWTTENEHDYTLYTIERSTDNGKNFVVLDTLASIGSGAYDITDKKPAQSVNLYRLKQRDINGTISYSSVAQADLSPQAKPTGTVGFTLSIYPNPVANVVNIAVPDHAATGYHISITNISGFQVRQAKTNTGTSLQAEVGDLKPGIYLVKIVDDKDQRVMGFSKFMKQ